MQYEYHPLADQYPLMPEAELRLLAEAMMQHGFNTLFPIVLHDGKILDGRNRYRAALLACVDPEFITLDDGMDPEAFVEQANEHRRHLAQDWLQKRRQERVERVAKARRSGDSLRVIAASEGVSESQVRRDLEVVTAPGGAVEPRNGTVTGRDGRTTRPASGRKRKPTSPTPSAEGSEPAEPKDAASQTPTKPADVDAFGIPVQPHAAEAFAARPLFDDLLAKLRECRRLYAKLAEHPGGVGLLQPNVSVNAREAWRNKGIENAILGIEDARPYATVCPYDYNAEAKHPEDCTLCRGRGWTTPFTKNRVPSDLIDAAKGAFGV